MRSGLAFSAILLLALSGVSSAETAASDPRAVHIADDVMKSLGGKKKWDALEGLRWTFGASVNDTVRSTRRHAWDKRTGWHRVEGKTRAGDAFVFVHKLGTDEGHAWMNGHPIEGDSLQKLIKRAHSLWINDTYWMLMPYKLRDPGVTLAMASDTTLNGMTCDRLALSFEKVGDTPGDHYWVWVDRTRHRVVRWEMVLQGDQPPPRAYTWEGWEVHDGLWFPTAHHQENVNIFTNAVETVKAFGPNEFSAP